MELRVDGLNVIELPLQTRRPFRVSTGQTVDPIHVICRLTIDGLAGYGAAGPYRVTNETHQTITAVLRDAEKKLKSRTFAHATTLREWIQTHLQESPSAAAALDMAVWDWQGRHANKPVYQLINPEKHRLSVTTDMTIGLESEKDTLDLVAAHIESGFDRLKIKMGHPLTEQKKLLFLIRAKAGSSIQLIADANQAYTAAEALELSNTLNENNFLLLEQPVAASNLNALGEVSGNSVLPVFADEAASTIEKIHTIGEKKLAHGIVLKILKFGGISNTLHALTAAKQYCLQLMLGCNTETTLSIAAALHVALAHPEIEHIDLDGHILLEGNPLEVFNTNKNQLSPLGVGLGDDRQLRMLFS